MYEYFEGTVVEKGTMHCVLEVGSRNACIAYHLTVSATSSGSIVVGNPTRLFAHLHVRDAEQRLFGFATREERSLFHLLMTVAGVGPALAIKILSGCPHGELRQVIQKGDAATLRKVRGVGAKTAERIIVELRDTIATLCASDALDAATQRSSGDVQALEDALLALLALGYPRPTAEKALLKAKEDGESPAATPDEWVRRALRRL